MGSDELMNRSVPFKRDPRKKIIKETPESPLTPLCETIARIRPFMSQEMAHTRHQIYQHLDPGLSTLQDCEKEICII